MVAQSLPVYIQLAAKPYPLRLNTSVRKYSL